MEKLRRRWVHALCNVSLWLIRKSVAHRAVLFIDLSPAKIALFFSDDWRCGNLLFLNMGIQGHVGKFLLKGHGRVRHRHGCAPARKVEVAASRDEQYRDQNAEN